MRAAVGSSSRRAVVMVLVLVVLLVVVSLGALLLRATLVQHKLLRTQERSLQAIYLAEAGLSRGAAQLRRSPDYAGETWRPALAARSGEAPLVAEVEISATRTSVEDSNPAPADAREDNPAPESGQLYRLTVVARYPSGDPLALVQRREILLNLESGPPQAVSP